MKKSMPMWLFAGRATVNVENTKKWVDALRSGKYLQTSGQLGFRYEGSYGDDSYCCLGVACMTAIENGEDVHKKNESDSMIAFDGVTGLLPHRVSKWLGLGSVSDDGSGDIPILAELNLNDFTGTVTASTMNDNMGATFEQIADAIERTYLLPLEGYES